MKKLVYFFVTVIAFTVFSVRGSAADAPVSPQTGPSLAAAAFLEDVKNWDGTAAVVLASNFIPEEKGTAYWELARPLLTKLEYQIGNAKVEGRSAQVDISVTGLIVTDAAKEIAAEAVALNVIKRLSGLELDVESHISSRISRLLEDGDLISMRTNCTMFLTLGGDGKWKLDLTDSRNAEVAYAILGIIKE